MVHLLVTALSLKRNTVYSYNLLEKDCYYLVKEEEKSNITLILIVVITDFCFFIKVFDDPTYSYWRKKDDPLFEIIECLDDEKATEWLKQYKKNQGEYFREEDDDDDDFEDQNT